MEIKQTKFLSLFGLFTPLLFWSTTLILGVLSSDYNFIHDAVSLLGAKGEPYMIVMNLLGFFLTGIFMTLFAFGIYRVFMMEGKNLTGPILFIVSALMFSSIGFFPFDIDNLSSAVNIFHILALVLTIFLGVISSILVHFQLRGGNSILSPLSKFTLFTGIFLISTLTLFIFADYIGLIERINLAIFMIWMILISIRILQSDFEKIGKKR